MLQRALRILLPGIWLGLILGISFIEAPLKFQAPDITIPLGLGIGRLVFAAMNIAEGVIALALLLAMWRGRASRPEWILGIAVALTLAVKALVVRPLMHATTDAVIAGASEGGSGLHYVYIAADVLLIALLIALVATTARKILATATR
ncbi:hypothetical protein [uncultured Agrococcus sp.]|uniref:hypothetical protein n=1 Tax=uncultured Agrococcus sp. TaxID=382258 RepID=UPI0025D6BA36|nr:hypothetical protein [uncultured Agrococcus sp.]